MKKLFLALACTSALVFASTAAAVDFGANDDTGKYSADGGSGFFGQMAATGLKQNVMTVRWQPSAPTTIADRAFLDRAVPRAVAAGIKPILAVYPYPPRELEGLSADQHAANAQQFAAWLAQLARTYPAVSTYIVGNEPNLNTFWRPQGDGTKVLAAATFGPYLAAGYDALKGVSSGIAVLGVGHSPRGDTTPDANGKSSPVAFLKALGEWYRASGRSAPLMDGFSYHPYPNPSDFTVGLDWRYGWPNAGVQELDRVKQALHDAFSGTGQPTTVNGLKLYLDEVGWQTDVPGGAGYTDSENVKVGSAEFQAEVYAQLVRYVVCDPDVAQLNFFGFYDERSLIGWQSALYYVNGQAKPSAAAVQRAIAETGGRCSGAPRSWNPEQGVVGANADFPASDKVIAKQRVFGFSVGAAEQATYTAGIFPAGTATSTISRELTGRQAAILSTTGEIKANFKPRVEFRGALAEGRYVYAIKLAAWANPSRSEVLVSRPFSVGEVKRGQLVDPAEPPATPGSATEVAISVGGASGITIGIGLISAISGGGGAQVTCSVACTLTATFTQTSRSTSAVAAGVAKVYRTTLKLKKGKTGRLVLKKRLAPGTYVLTVTIKVGKKSATSRSKPFAVNAKGKVVTAKAVAKAAKKAGKQKA